MLITFSSQAYANVTLFAEAGKKLLKMMGCQETASGAISAESVHSALTCLEKAVLAQKEAATTDASRDADADFSDEKVSLAMRALPLIEMLKAAEKEKSNVWWETK